MYKRIICIITLIAVALCGCARVNQKSETPESKQKESAVKSVFLTYYELSDMLIGKSETDFKLKISDTFEKLSKKGFNRVTVHVRPYADAMYISEYFPSSYYCTGKQGSPMSFDPLKIMTEYAHKYGMSIEAWVNPYRVSSSTDFSKLSDDNIAKKWRNTDKLIVIKSGIYFNPAEPKVTELIVNGVKEIVVNYDIDSICFDDYFYPTDDKEIDSSYYKKYKKKGDMKLADWRRRNINNMVKSVYKAVKAIDSNVTFGISPACNIDNNYNKLYADVKEWCTHEGYVDYICPQIYFGFKNENQPFMKSVKSWCYISKVTLYVALPLYKSGEYDKYAGELGKNEFKDNDNIVSRQIAYISKLDEVKGYYIFSYGDLKDNNETENLYSAMQNS